MRGAIKFADISTINIRTSLKYFPSRQLTIYSVNDWVNHSHSGEHTTARSCLDLCIDAFYCQNSFSSLLQCLPTLPWSVNRLSIECHKCGSLLVNNVFLIIIKLCLELSVINNAKILKGSRKLEVVMLWCWSNAVISNENLNNWSLLLFPPQVAAANRLSLLKSNISDFHWIKCLALDYPLIRLLR